MSIAARLTEIQARVAAACARAGRRPEDVRVLAVSKLQPPELIEEAYKAGQRDFGENYVQELLDKKRRLAHLEGIRWHLIGHLQTNKVRQVVNEADFFHALDSEKLVREIDRRATRPWPVFIQVNVDGEASKSGVAPEEVAGLLAAVEASPQLVLEGLMCIPEPRDDMRPAFRRVAELARAVSPTRALRLSMGMSGDFEAAVEEGAHWVRVGTRLFGERPRH